MYSLTRALVLKVLHLILRTGGFYKSQPAKRPGKRKKHYHHPVLRAEERRTHIITQPMGLGFTNHHSGNLHEHAKNSQALFCKHACFLPTPGGWGPTNSKAMRAGSDSLQLRRPRLSAFMNSSNLSGRKVWYLPRCTPGIKAGTRTPARSFFIFIPG